MIIKLILLVIFNFVYTLNNYSGISNFIIINIILFLLEFFIVKIKQKFNIKKLCLSSLITICLIIINKEIFIYGYDNQTIYLTNLNNVPIEINSIYFNNEKVVLNKNNFSLNNTYDIYNKITSNYKFDLINFYSFKTNRAKKIIINFEKYNYSYNLLLNDELLSIPASVIDNSSKYYKIYDNYFSYTINNVNYNNAYAIVNFVISFLGLNIIILSILENIKKQNLLAIFLALSLFIFEFNDLILINIIYKIILFLFIIFICFVINNFNDKMLIKDKKRIILIIIASLITTFMFIGSLYLNEKINIKDIIVFILFILWFSFIIQIININLSENHIKLIKHNKVKLLDQILLFLIPLIIFIIYLCIFSPYIITTDGDMQLGEILHGSVTNWHPYFHTVLISICYDIFGNFVSFIVIRIIIVSFIISLIGSYFIFRGISKKIIYIIVLLICLNPVTGVYMVSILKDTDYAIFLTLLIFVLIKYINGDKSLLNHILMFISLLFVATFRHNGLYVTLSSLFMLLIIAVKSKNIKLLVNCVLVLISIYLINNNLSQYLNVQPGLRNADVASLAHGLQAVTIEHNDEEIDNFFSDYITLDEIKDSYNKYNIDVLLHYNTIPFRNIELNKFDLIKLYINKIRKYPSTLLCDRLYGIDIMWNVFKSDFIQTYDYQIVENEFGFEYYSDYKISIKNSFLRKIFINILLFISNNKLLNALLLRGGIYLGLILVLTLNFSRKANFIFLFPLLANTLTLIITLQHQSYRYVMFMPFIFIIYVLKIVSDEDKY